MPELLVINPNSNATVTANIEHALSVWGGAPVEIRCLTNHAGPDTISSDEDALCAAQDVLRLGTAATADAILVACFSDPGLASLRSSISCPVFGIQEASILMALARAPRYGIIALSQRAVPRHLARIEALSLKERCAGEIGLSGYSALDVGRSDAAFEEAVAAANELRGQGAEVIILGCAGFGPRRAKLEALLQMPVIDPVLAGASFAIGTLISNLPASHEAILV